MAGLKRYLLFAGSTYYPTAGFGDFIESYDSWEDAIKEAETTRCDWWQVIDTHTPRPTVKFYGYGKES